METSKTPRDFSYMQTWWMITNHYMSDFRHPKKVKR